MWVIQYLPYNCIIQKGGIYMDFGEIYKYSEGHTFHEADANFKIIEFDLLKISEIVY